ncbi:lipopolysaccharide biosynthesis protein [Actinoplanes sp. TRM 88003]|uniref:Lipopolysaccharide biosynthesis protein n=1 Tax=Paractinoplanes aksuensis TaxID=2939490 RepID=A0ABT1DLT1_9ACTN|nr:lipopolysaccharide biosynthesis protein [Actinoplanes aksuensis]MCO8271755.1 lipopolysaccharide biosynthesis protein [Actinoplanes aksuensis]
MKLAVGEEGSLFSRAGRALGWSFASTALAKLSTLAIGIVLARLLGPEEFGTFAVATVVLLAVLSFNELGVSLAIVRWPGDPREIAPTVTTISVASSALICLLCYLFAPAFSALMGAPDATPVVRVLGLSVLVSGLVAAPVAMLQRTFRQDRKMIADQVATWTTAGISVALAVGGVGAMSLAVGQLAGSIVGAVLYIAFAPRSLRFGFDPGRARALLKFGLPLAGSSIVVFAATNVDKVVVGAVLGPVPLGFYVLAANLANWPATMFSQPVRAVAPALLARLQSDPPAMRATFLSTGGLLAALTLPACVVLAAAAGPLVTLVYGAVWAPAATVLTWLGLLAALRILFELVYDYFVVLAHTRVVLTVQVVWFAALAPALYFGAQAGGAAGAGAAAFAVAAVVVAPIYLYELHRTGVSVAALGARLLPAGLAAAGIAAVTVPAVTMLGSNLLKLLIAGVAAGAALALLLYRLRDSVRSLRSVGEPVAA